MSIDSDKGLARGLTNYGDKDFSIYLRRSFALSMGYSKEVLKKPIVGIANTFSGFNNCHRHFPELLEAIKRGVLLGGGLPLEFPTISLGEVFLTPTSLKFRNLMSMDTEEMIRAQPMDAVVLMGGCDKTVPAQLMGAASADLPAVQLVAGPMMTSRYEEERLGACTDCRRFWGNYRANKISSQNINQVEGRLATTSGTCAVMGTASTMGSMVEALGMSLPHNAAIPAVDARRYALAHMSGKRIVEMVKENLIMSKVVSKKSFENAIKVNGAIGGSTNAVIHLAAVAGRLEIDLSLDDWEKCGKDIPTLVNLQPSGKYLMEDFYYAGGVPAVIKQLLEKNLLSKDALTVNGKTIEENNLNAERWNKDVIKDFENPLVKDGGIKILKGNIAPDGAILKPSAASPELMQHKGKAVVFESVEEFHDKIDDPNLDVDENSILVLKNCGPKGYPGMAEVGNMRLPQKILKKGIRDMIRISDARMSGTAYGTVILHTSPEAAVKGPLAAVQNGDLIEVDVNKGTLNLDVTDEIIAKRLEEYQPVLPEIKSGYQKMYIDHVMQADKGADLDFLVGKRGSEVKRHSH